MCMCLYVYPSCVNCRKKNPIKLQFAEYGSEVHRISCLAFGIIWTICLFTCKKFGNIMKNNCLSIEKSMKNNCLKFLLLTLQTTPNIKKLICIVYMHYNVLPIGKGAHSIYYLFTGKQYKIFDIITDCRSNFL